MNEKFPAGSRVMWHVPVTAEELAEDPSLERYKNRLWCFGEVCEPSPDGLVRVRGDCSRAVFHVPPKFIKVLR